MMQILWISHPNIEKMLSKKQKTAKNRFFIIILFVLLIGLTSYTFSNSNVPKETSDRYTDFCNSYLQINNGFNPSNCKKPVDLSNTFLSISIPNNSLVNSKDDNYKGNYLQPRNKKIYFTDNEEKILYEISYLFVDDNLETDVVTINSIQKDQIEDWIETDTVLLNPSYEFVLLYKNSIILIDCTYLHEDLSTIEESDYFHESVRVFFQEFTNFLSSQ